MISNNLQDTPQSLALHIQQGSKKAFAELYDAYAPALFGVISRIVGDEKKAGEVLQMSFLETWKLKETYDAGKERFFNWIMKIARDTALQGIQATPNGNSEISGTNNLVNGTELKDNPAAKNTMPANVPAAGSHDEKEALYLIYFKGCTLSEAALQLGIPIDTLHTKLRMAIQQYKGEPIP